MQTTFYIGKNPKHKINVSFQKNGKEIIHVDGKCVLNNWSISRKGSRAFNVGKHNVSIEYVGNFYDWSCKVFVDDCLYMHELFPAELEIRKIETANLGKFFKVLGIGLILVLFFFISKWSIQGDNGRIIPDKIDPEWITPHWEGQSGKP